MIKAVTQTRDGRPLLMLGLSHKNLDYIREDKPIPVELSDLGLPDIQLVLFAGVDEQDMIAQLQRGGAIIDKLIDNRPEADK